MNFDNPFKFSKSNFTENITQSQNNRERNIVVYFFIGIY